MDASSSATWQEIAQEARDHRDASIAQIQPSVPDVPEDKRDMKNITDIPKQILADVQIKITEMTPHDLLDRLAAGTLTSTEVIRAFLVRAALAQKLVNCVAEVLPSLALERAAYLDAYLTKHKHPVGPLHGLPVSVKSHISFAGRPIPCGFVGWWHGKPRPQNHAQVLQILHDAGAVFYVRTTEPQCLMHLETSSNLYGETVNPYNRTLTCGGSSGGEGALLGMRGSCMGIGTDIGGSIRSPAANCGVWGYRPTALRLPDLGCQAPMKGYDSITPVLGPLSTTFEGLELFVKTVLSAKPWLVDPRLWPVGWRTAAEVEGHQEWFERPDQRTSESEIESDKSSKSKSNSENRRKKIRIGVLWHDNVVRPHPPVSRALATLVQRLRAFSPSQSPIPKIDSEADSQVNSSTTRSETRSEPNIEIEIVDFHPYEHDEAWDIISSLYFPDNGNDEKYTMALTNEPWRPLTEWILNQKGVKEYTIPELWVLNTRREAYKLKYAAHWRRGGQLAGAYDSKGTTSISHSESENREDGEKQEQEDKAVDILITPVGPSVAPPLNHARYWSYTSQWNLLDYPALVFPVGFVNAATKNNRYTFPTGQEHKPNPSSKLPLNQTPASATASVPGKLTAASSAEEEEAAYLSPTYEPLSAQDAENRSVWFDHGGWTGFADAPVALQIVARRGDDEKLFAAVKILKEIIGLCETGMEKYKL